MSRQPAFLYLLHIHAKPQGTYIYACQLIIRQEALAHGVHKLLITDRQKLPFSDGLNRAYLLRGDVYFVVSTETETAVMRTACCSSWHVHTWYCLICNL